jgi:hypothetical protein
MSPIGPLSKPGLYFPTNFPKRQILGAAYRDAAVERPAATHKGSPVVTDNGPTSCQRRQFWTEDFEVSSATETSVLLCC